VCAYGDRIRVSADKLKLDEQIRADFIPFFSGAASFDLCLFATREHDFESHGIRERHDLRRLDLR
jgi:hypothetical protein